VPFRKMTICSFSVYLQHSFATSALRIRSIRMGAGYRELAERKEFLVAGGGFEPLTFGLTSHCYWQPERLVTISLLL